MSGGRARVGTGGTGGTGRAPRTLPAAPRPAGLRRFPAERERAFQTERNAARSRAFVVTALIGLTLFDLYVLVDVLTFPQVAVVSAVARWAVVTPLALLGLWWRRRRLARCPASRVDGPLVAGSLVLQVGALAVVSRSAPAEVADSYFLGAQLLVLFSVVLLRSDVRHSALVALTTLVAFAAASAAPPGTDPALTLATLLTVVVSGGFGVSMAAGLEAGERSAFLARAREAELVAEQARLIEALATANAGLAEAARRDGLTGVLNRRGLDEHLRGLRDGGACAVMLDVDRFKAYNDALGHERGDECLRRVAAALQAQLRPGDVLARFGGEEFTVLLAEATDADGALGLAGRLREAVEALALPHPAPHPARPEGCPGVVTISAGVACGGPVATLLGRADEALYAAKAAGRNAVRRAPAA
ncbi:GGDEF domain-containing protein [Paenibacillus sp. TRM 82003]|uniref:GGDEF domain-containing protein n=1 Tax=Kineococcus sp. TRM81007 TaxID=2925831 RepID=UPI001F59467A|nr:GGDEF domain-containing protein [Kineococcus sp. TRM81007]MCI2238891.1 GGDEF domain-containing protein [Kineococcus sp. TRM81007]MCI3924296.1 GGDEF domain-containing protein [Paenibacillus sp. TRM 82003]